MDAQIRELQQRLEAAHTQFVAVASQLDPAKRDVVGVGCALNFGQIGKKISVNPRVSAFKELFRYLRSSKEKPSANSIRTNLYQTPTPRPRR